MTANKKGFPRLTHAEPLPHSDCGCAASTPHCRPGGKAGECARAACSLPSHACSPFPSQPAGSVDPPSREVCSHLRGPRGPVTFLIQSPLPGFWVPAPTAPCLAALLSGVLLATSGPQVLTHSLPSDSLFLCTELRCLRTSRAEEELPLPLRGYQLLLPASSPPGPRRPSTSALPSAAGRGGSHQGPVEGRPEPSLKGALRVARGGPGNEDRQGLGQHVHSLKAGSGPHRGHQPVPGALWQLLSAAAAQLYRFSVPKLLLKSGGTAANSGRLGFYLVILNCHLVNRHWFCIY